MPHPHVRAGLGTAVAVALLCPMGVAAGAPTARLSAPTVAPEQPLPFARPEPKPKTLEEEMGVGIDPSARAKLVVPARNYGPLGVDVSNWQGKNVNWRRLWAQGKRFAYIKATEGTSYRSPSFSSQYTNSYKSRYIRGAYHYANPAGKAGWRQANYFVDHGGGWSKDGRTLPGMLDIEYGKTSICYGRSKARMVRWITSFLNQYKKRTGRHAVIYTTAGWWTACTGNTTRFSKTNPLFIARWRSDPGVMPGGWKTWAFWQYTDTPIDQDMFNGSPAKLLALANGPDRPLR